MNKKYLSTVLLAAVALSPLALVQAASLIGVNYGPALEAGVNDSANINTELEQDADLDASLDMEANVQNDADVSGAGNGVNLSSGAESSIEGEVMTVRRADLEDEANRSAIANFRNSFNSSVQPGIPNTGESAIENADENAFENASEQSILLRADSVATQEDLRIFAMAALEANEDLEAMSFANDEVMVSYKAPGSFIGIIPVAMNTSVTVSQDGQVEFDYPWYSFLVVKDAEELEAAIQSEVDAVLAASADGGWTNYDRAKLAGSIASALEAHYESSIEIDSEQAANTGEEV